MCLSVHRVGGIPACLAGGIQACLAGLQGCVSQYALQVSRPTPKGGLRALAKGVGSPGPHPGGCLQAHTHGGVSQHALRQTPQLMATAVGSTYPTGMHSFLRFYEFPLFRVLDLDCHLPYAHA